MKKINIEKTKLINNQLYLIPKDVVPSTIANTFKAGEQLLVDSDQLEFIYLLDANEQFVHVHIPFPIWPDIQKAMEEKLDVGLILNEEKTLICTNFHEELYYLLDNIKDNGNYGTKLPSAVETVFSNE